MEKKRRKKDFVTMAWKTKIRMGYWSAINYEQTGEIFKIFQQPSCRFLVELFLLTELIKFWFAYLNTLRLWDHRIL